MIFYELATRYDRRQSFYGKAKILEQDGVITLLSYDTPVARIKNGKFEINANVCDYLLYSNTTLRHIKEFYRQFVEYKSDLKKSDFFAFEIEF
jgi:hypothetical protein